MSTCPAAPPPWSYLRRATREVRIGDVGVGGSNPIRVQSMTTPATTDTRATVDQIERLVAAGCEIVRVTVPSKADADNLPAIRAALRARRLGVPLVADIHFTPAAAMLAVEHVDKVRVNPGNFADKKRFAEREYSDAEYREELDRIAERFLPLVRRARKLGVAMRIGTNHGSLSDRILNRYGDTPAGMVESALEFARIARAEGYEDLVLSMKSSNPLVAIAAYRLLVRRMDEEGMDYPLHLGVTEAGDGEDGRIKSAIGIGALLDEGLGDTVRVSLTEDPVAEIPVAFELVRPYNERLARRGAAGPGRPAAPAPSAPAPRRASRAVRLGALWTGGANPVRNEARLRAPLADEPALHREIAECAGLGLAEERRAELLAVEVSSDADAAAVIALRRLLDEHGIGTPLAAELAPQLVLAPERLAGLLRAVARAAGLPPPGLDSGAWTGAVAALAAAARQAGAAYLAAATPDDVPAFLAAGLADPSFEGPVETALLAARTARLAGAEVLAAAWTPAEPGPARACRLLAARLDAAGIDAPILALDCPAPGRDALIAPAVSLGALLADGLADAIQVRSRLGPGRDVRWSFDLLQAARQRVVKTEFISCPSCGRTQFDLESTTRRIKQRTAHLKGLKIAIMGCIVNGPGEMADADFGYVGWGPGKVSLFAGKTMVAKDVPEAEADSRLIDLIREHGRWVEPPAHLG